MNEESKKPEQVKADKEKEKLGLDPAKAASTQVEKDQGQDATEEKKQPEQKPAPEAPGAEKKEETEAKKKKINRLTLQEVEEKIKEVQEKMGGLSSAYAQQLLKRKEGLLQEKEDQAQVSEKMEKDDAADT